MDAYAAIAASITYENSGSEYEDIPYTQEPVLILGEKYSALHDRDDIREKILSRIWFTYRKNFPPIGDTSGRSSDTSWGCMHRVGQMVLAEALVRLHTKRNWRWNPDSENIDPNYHRIIKMFQDKKGSLYSIHQIASMGVSEGRQIGEWFGPNTVAQVIKKLSVYDDWSNLAVHIAMDNALIMDDLAVVCSGVNAPASLVAPVRVKESSPQISPNNGNIIGNDINDGQHDFVDEYDCIESEMFTAEDEIKPIPTSVPTSPGNKSGKWKPLLLFIPLRLGLSEFNACYMTALKRCFEIPYTVGVLGGRPSHALWFFGYVGDEMIFLDPHTTQPSVNLDNEVEDSSYHCQMAGRMHITKLDPSLCLAFFCRNEDEVHKLGLLLIQKVIRPSKTAMFEVHQRRPAHLPPFRPYQAPCSSSWESDEVSIVNKSLFNESRAYDSSDDDFELI